MSSEPPIVWTQAALAPTALLAWTLVFVLASLRWFPWTDRR